MVMKVATTIQISAEVDQKIIAFKKILRLPTKKAVVLEGLNALEERLAVESRRARILKASLRMRRQSSEINREWAPQSKATESP